MRGAILPLPQYAFMAWCSVKAQGQLYLYLCLSIVFIDVGILKLVLCSISSKIRGGKTCEAFKLGGRTKDETSSFHYISSRLHQC
jgi:hypothetical protein